MFVKSKFDRAVYCQRIENIELLDGEEVVSRYPEEMRHDVIDGWVCPRSRNGYTGLGSGTPYREIKLDSMKKLDDFFGQE